MSKHKKIRFIIHYVKPTAQLLFRIRFPKGGPTCRRQVVNPRHQTPQGQSVAKPETLYKLALTSRQFKTVTTDGCYKNLIKDYSGQSKQWLSTLVCHFGIYSQRICKIFVEYQSPLVCNAKAMLWRHSESWDEPVIFYLDISAMRHTTVWK